MFGRAAALLAATSGPAAPETWPEGATAPPGTTIGRVRLDLPVRSEPGYYWISRPPGYGRGDKPPLLICLHGTDDTARQMMDFWAACRPRIPMVMASPQGVGKGWSDADLGTIRAMMSHLQANVSYDGGRVLLAGFSAGGAMTLFLLYKEKLPVTAAAALANYVPPRITAGDVADRGWIPVFYAVGMADLNHERMRHGLDILRAAGGNVELYRPPIGHVLDPQVGQAALEWFFNIVGERVAKEIAGATEEAGLAHACVAMERIINQARWHEPQHVEAARATLEKLERAGRAGLALAEGRIREKRVIEAYEALRELETRYGGARMGRQAAEARARLERDPDAQRRIRDHQGQKRAEEAMTLYRSAQRLVAEARYRDAMGKCEEILAQYGDTPAAPRAQYLLELLRSKVSE